MRIGLKDILFVAAIVLLATAAGSCDWVGAFSTSGVSGTSSSTTVEPSSGQEDSPHYSSFGVRIETADFALMSFKDVGLGRREPTPADPMLEAIAQSVAYEFQERADVDVEPRVVYDEGLSDPTNHTYCEDGRIYVDVWRSEAPDRWGYSLWSGCSASHKFASDEVRIETSPEEADLETSLEPLASDIVESFADAVDHGCYRQTC